MFHTYSDAELKISAKLWGLDSLGERTWRWIELGLHIPYFYLSISLSDGEGFAMKRHFFFSQLDEVVDFINMAKESNNEVEVGLFSPGYMNGTDFYKFAKLKEIWVHHDSASRKFILDDGSIMVDSIIDEELKDDDYSLVMSL